MNKKDNTRQPLTLAPLSGAMKGPIVVSEEEARQRQQRRDDMRRWKQFQQSCPEYNKWIS